MSRDRSVPNPTLLSSCMSTDTWEPIGRLCRHCMAGRTPWSTHNCPPFPQVSYTAWPFSLHASSTAAELQWQCSRAPAHKRISHIGSSVTQLRATKYTDKYGHVQNQKDNQKCMVLCAECIQQSQPCFQEETFTCKGLVQENRATSHEAWGQKKYSQHIFCSFLHCNSPTSYKFLNK